MCFSLFLLLTHQLLWLIVTPSNAHLFMPFFLKIHQSVTDLREWKGLVTFSVLSVFKNTIGFNNIGNIASDGLWRASSVLFYSLVAHIYNYVFLLTHRYSWLLFISMDSMLYLIKVTWMKHWKWWYSLSYLFATPLLSIWPKTCTLNDNFKIIRARTVAMVIVSIPIATSPFLSANVYKHHFDYNIAFSG